MRQTIAAALALLALAACPEVATGPQGPEGPQGPAGYSALASGTRIKARVGTTPDGAKLFLGWHDAELGVDCEFLKASDGLTRCLPVGPVVQAGTLFADSSCSKPVVRLELGVSEPPPAFVRSSPDGSLETSAWRVWSHSEPPTFGIWPDNSCAAYEPSIRDGWFAAENITQRQPSLTVSVE